MPAKSPRKPYSQVDEYGVPIAGVDELSLVGHPEDTEVSHVFEKNGKLSRLLKILESLLEIFIGDFVVLTKVKSDLIWCLLNRENHEIKVTTPNAA